MWKLARPLRIAIANLLRGGSAAAERIRSSHSLRSTWEFRKRVWRSIWRSTAWCVGSSWTKALEFRRILSLPYCGRP